MKSHPPPQPMAHPRHKTRSRGRVRGKAIHVQERLAVYAGTFDVLTIGHLWMIQ